MNKIRNKVKNKGQDKVNKVVSMDERDANKTMQTIMNSQMSLVYERDKVEMPVQNDMKIDEYMFSPESKN